MFVFKGWSPEKKENNYINDSIIATIDYVHVQWQFLNLFYYSEGC
jgi:hypothetical protein